MRKLSETEIEQVCGGAIADNWGQPRQPQVLIGPPLYHFPTITPKTAFAIGGFNFREQFLRDAAKDS
jgi:hypothetical protein